MKLCNELLFEKKYGCILLHSNRMHFEYLPVEPLSVQCFVNNCRMFCWGEQFNESGFFQQFIYKKTLTLSTTRFFTLICWCFYIKIFAVSSSSSSSCSPACCCCTSLKKDFIWFCKDFLWFEVENGSIYGNQFSMKLMAWMVERERERQAKGQETNENNIKDQQPMS